MSQYIFYFLSFLSILSALFVVFSKNPMHSVLYLVLCFFSIAGHYVLLNAQFLAIVHIIVYAGAIMVLFLFVVMLLNLNTSNEAHKSSMMKVAATITSGALLLILVAALRTYEINLGTGIVKSDIGLVKNLGKVLFTDYVLPFEICSVLFLSAMIGAVVLAKKD